MFSLFFNWFILFLWLHIFSLNPPFFVSDKEVNEGSNPDLFGNIACNMWFIYLKLQTKIILNYIYINKLCQIFFKYFYYHIRLL